MKKKRWALALTALFMLVFCFVRPLAAGVRAPDLVRVGYFDYGGFLDCDESGKFYGYGYEYLEEVANYTGWRYEFVRGTWRELLRKLADGEIDLLCCAQYTKERAGLYEYSEDDCGVEYTTVFVKADNDAIYYGDVESFQGLRMGMVRGGYQNGRFERFARANGIQVEEVYYDAWGEADAAMKRGEVDARVSGSMRHTSDEKIVLRISPEPFYFISAKGNRAVMDAVDKAMEEIKTWDANFNSRLYDKYYGADMSGQLAFTRAEAEFIRQNRTLRVAYNKDWPPLIYEGPEGIFHGLFEKISEKSGLAFTYVPAPSFEAMVNLVRFGEADMACYYPRERLQEARERQLALTKSYISVPLEVVCREGMTAAELRRVALPKSQTDLALVAQSVYPQAETLYFSDMDACLKAVWHGEADAVLGNTYYLNQALKKYGMLESVPAALIQYPLSIAVSQRADPALLMALNKVVAQFTPDEVNAAVLDRTVHALDQQNAAYLLRRYLPYAAVVLGLGLFLLVYRSRQILRRYAFIDQLTGGVNQTKFVMEAEKRIRDKFDGEYAILCFDIDRFKVINDLYGYRTGNHLLRDIAKVLKAHVAGDELFCRASGDNYVLLLKNGEALEQKAVFLLERVCGVAGELDENLRFTVSAGVYVMNEPVDGIHIAIDRANLARQSVKGEHGASLAFYTDAMRQRVLREQELENRLEGALANREFQVYYQPKFTVSGQNVVGAEALVRWRALDGTMIYPDEFIPVFEGNGSIIKLDLYVFRTVCQDLRRWLDAGYSPYPISVNLSRMHLYQKDFYQEYLSVMRGYNIPSYYVELELTESTMFENQQQLIQVMGQIKSQGILISMDDFGSGYSSLNLLKDLPIDTLKIDREFFNQAADNSRGQKIIRSVVAMARQLDILVVSEGVETQEHVDFLRAINCQVAQGFYFSKPVPAGEYEAMAFLKKADAPEKAGHTA